MTTPHLTPAVGDWVIDRRWEVYGADTKPIGTVADVHPDYLVVRKGMLFRRERYVPVSTITHVERECVYLNVSSTEIDDRGWDRIPDGQATAVALDDPSVRPVAGSVAG